MASLPIALATLALTALLGSCNPTTTAVPTASGNIVDLGYAKYQGVFTEAQNVTSFSGIRYAAPPTGMPPCHVFSRTPSPDNQFIIKGLIVLRRQNSLRRSKASKSLIVHPHNACRGTRELPQTHHSQRDKYWSLRARRTVCF